MSSAGAPTSDKILIDVRSATEYESGHLATAVNIPYTEINHLPTLHPEVTFGSTAISLYCHSGRRSAIALDTLRELGYGHVRDLGALEDAERLLSGESERDGNERGLDSRIIGTDGLQESWERLMGGLKQAEEAR